MADKKKQVIVRSDNGSVVMSMSDLGVEGDRIYIEGALMGAWPSKMYVDTESIPVALQMVFSHPELLGFAKRLPDILGGAEPGGAK